MDLLMLGVDGFSVLEAVRSGRTAHPPAAVIAVSALTDRKSLERWRDLRVDSIRPKPFTIGERLAPLQAFIREPV